MSVLVWLSCSHLFSHLHTHTHSHSHIHIHTHSPTKKCVALCAVIRKLFMASTTHSVCCCLSWSLVWYIFVWYVYKTKVKKKETTTSHWLECFFFCLVLHLFLFLFVLLALLEGGRIIRWYNCLGAICYICVIVAAGHLGVGIDTKNWTGQVAGSAFFYETKTAKLELVKTLEMVKSKLVLRSRCSSLSLCIFVHFCWSPPLVLSSHSVATCTDSEQAVGGTLQPLSMGKLPHCCLMLVYSSVFRHHLQSDEDVTYWMIQFIECYQNTLIWEWWNCFVNGNRLQ